MSKELNDLLPELEEEYFWRVYSSRLPCTIITNTGQVEQTVNCLSIALRKKKKLMSINYSLQIGASNFVSIESGLEPVVNEALKLKKNLEFNKQALQHKKDEKTVIKQICEHSGDYYRK